MAGDGAGGPKAGEGRSPMSVDPVKAVRARPKQRQRLVERAGLLAIGGLMLVLGAMLLFALFGPGPRARESDTTLFVVEAGQGASSVASGLSQAGLVRSGVLFRVSAILTGHADDMKPGEYEIPSRASPGRIAAILASGKSVRRTLTVPEGWTVAMAMRRIAENPILTGPLPEAPPEGSMRPDTYVITRTMTRTQLVQQMTAAQTRLLDELWLSRAPDVPVRNKQEALVLASIVEKETGKPDEHGKVAAVFVNRLRLGMKLQSDPTIIYGITKGEPIGRRIRQSEIEMAHPWNTYVIPALPPTPIANPGAAALRAVLNPPRTRDLFFVADGTGGHVFAETYAEHNRNVLRWREWRRQQEEKDADLSGGEGK
jgi:UPF0755 protein